MSKFDVPNYTLSRTNGFLQSYMFVLTDCQSNDLFLTNLQLLHALILITFRSNYNFKATKVNSSIVHIIWKKFRPILSLNGLSSLF